MMYSSEPETLDELKKEYTYLDEKLNGMWEWGSASLNPHYDTIVDYQNRRRMIMVEIRKHINSNVMASQIIKEDE